jgi:uncharacterized protein (TIGR03066 family)
MKKQSRLAKLFQNRARPRNGTPNPEKDQPRSEGWLPRWAVALLCVLVAGGATFALFEYVILSKVPRALLGKWVVTEVSGDSKEGNDRGMEGATLEFFRDGTMIGTVNMNGKQGIIKARVRGNEKTLWSTTTNPMTGKDDTDVQTIVTLTDSELVVENNKGTVIKMQRVR